MRTIKIPQANMKGVHILYISFQLNNRGDYEAVKILHDFFP